MQQYAVIENDKVINIVVGVSPVKAGQQLELIEASHYCEETYLADGFKHNRFPTIGDSFHPENSQKRYKREVPADESVV